ncbi:helix-turn-helix transcriptional regulator [Rhodobacter sp. NTK016B]|uniref:LexA family transcriptional regulator n=1 Tax=Rhodobacter sp. NTK016B TaxID=2759676 RepID=UPI001A900670|nr:XRE family transcriptional regulator [Rhodobacter sp. NTK016B]MBN8294531.1 helix-turn-helix transcriptional regulator [Rhodobacter sp. NTK016B]
MSERLRRAREDAGFSDAASAARRFGWPETTYRAHENGQRNFPKKRAEIYARAFRVSPEWLLLGVGDARKKAVPLVGYVGAGAEVYAIDDGGALDEIDPPPGIGPSAVAVMVRGDSMYPRYMEGDVLIYDTHTPLQAADGQECVVSLTDGRKFVKLVRAEPDGSVTLESWNTPPIRRAQCEWLAAIIWVKRARTAGPRRG